jgi:hypothetical protein
MKILNNTHRLGVLRSAHGDCSNNGVTARFTDLTIVAVIDDKERFTPAVTEAAKKFVAKDPAATFYVKRFLYGKDQNYLIPAEILAAGKWPMFGGNFAHTSNGIFHEIDASGDALHVHDRVES